MGYYILYFNSYLGLGATARGMWCYCCCRRHPLCIASLSRLLLISQLDPLLYVRRGRNLLWIALFMRKEAEKV